MHNMYTLEENANTQDIQYIITVGTYLLSPKQNDRPLLMKDLP
jgi:hypothetical protein